MENEIRVLVQQDGESWVAQCLEYDIGAQAPDLETLRLRLGVVLRAELNESLLRSKVPFAGIPRSPKKYYELWKENFQKHPPIGSVEISTENDGVFRATGSLALCA